MKKKTLVFIGLLSLIPIYATDLTTVYEMPKASQIVKDDLIDKATKFTMPTSCKLDNLEAIARGKYLYHNLNSKSTKEPLPKGLRKAKDGEVKPYGNCVACHNIEGAIGGGNVGPDLTGYTGRPAQFVYQKIADARVSYAETSMTINLTTKMMNEQEICDLTAYVMQVKKPNKK